MVEWCVDEAAVLWGWGGEHGFRRLDATIVCLDQPETPEKLDSHRTVDKMARRSLRENLLHSHFSRGILKSVVLSVLWQSSILIS